MQKKQGDTTSETSTTESSGQVPHYRLKVDHVDDNRNTDKSFVVLKDSNNNIPEVELTGNRWLSRAEKADQHIEDKWVPSWADGQK